MDTKEYIEYQISIAKSELPLFFIGGFLITALFLFLIPMSWDILSNNYFSLIFGSIFPDTPTGARLSDGDYATAGDFSNAIFFLISIAPLGLFFIGGGVIKKFFKFLLILLKYRGFSLYIEELDVAALIVESAPVTKKTVLQTKRLPRKNIKKILLILSFCEVIFIKNKTVHALHSHALE